MSRSETVQIVRGHMVPPRDPQGRREGFTTGTAAAGAAKAACLVLARGERPERVTVSLPTGRTLDVLINRIEIDGESGAVTCGVVKDAGDDPDVTHGAEILATVRRGDAAGVVIRGGPGVGTVTRPGVTMPVGSPAINPVPQRMIRRAVAEAIGDGFNAERTTPGVVVTIAVPRGEELAKKTTNPRLGIVGGISILGTTGIVQAMSTAAWRASVLQAIDVAAANGVDHLILSTGERTEQFAMQRFAGMSEMAFIEMGIFTGDCVRRTARKGIPRVTICGMIGKLAKIAAGQLQTHVAGGVVDTQFLAALARAAGLSEKLAAEIATANSARHAQEIAAAGAAATSHRFLEDICRRAATACREHAGGQLAIDVLLIDNDGNLLATCE